MKYIFSLFLIIILSSCKRERDYISIVGSFTLYPSIISLAEKFSAESHFKTPVVEANGSGSGFRLFCEGISSKFPDMVNSSRKIKPEEEKYCKSNYVQSREIPIGYDAIIFIGTSESQINDLSTQDLYKAIARYIVKDGEIIENPYQYWSDIQPDLPHTKIKIYGPTSVSGTRDMLVEELLISPCVEAQNMIITYPNSVERRQFCSLVRKDGHFIETSENDNVTVLKLQSDQEAIAIVKFGFFKNNNKNIKAAKINHIYPSNQNIKNGSYKLRRVLYSYVKLNNLTKIPGLVQFVDLLVSESKKANGSVFSEWGLIALE